MTKRTNDSENLNISHNALDLEMLENLLQAEDESYPWNPSEENSEEYFYQLEQNCSIAEVLDEELTQRSQNFYQQLDLAWSKNLNVSYYKHNTQQATKANLQENLFADFSKNVPQELLSRIANKASEVIKSGKSLSEQLIECVNAVLPTLDSDDLTVMVRPYAFAMRGDNKKSKQVESTMESIGDREWSSLSDMDRAKVSFAIAHCAIQNLKNQNLNDMDV